MITLTGSRVLDVPIDRVWDVITDWEGQRHWIPMTEVVVRSEQREGVGTRCFAFSGVRLGPLALGLPDDFVVSEWQPPDRLVVQHVGSAFVGDGAFDLIGRADQTLVRLTERAVTPAGRLGDLALTALEPFLVAGIRFSLSRLERRVRELGRG